MRYHLRTLLISVMLSALAIVAFLYWDTSSVFVASGHRDLAVSIIRHETNAVSSITYATTDADLVQTVITNYPAPEPTFESIDDDTFILNVPFSFKVSRIGRDLGYSEAFDTIVFHVVYENQKTEFRTITIPDRNDPAKVELML